MDGSEIRFGSIAPVKAGWLTKNKGTWALTEVGREAYQKYQDPEQFLRQAILLYQDWEQSRETKGCRRGERQRQQHCKHRFSRLRKAAWVNGLQSAPRHGGTRRDDSPIKRSDQQGSMT